MLEVFPETLKILQGLNKVWNDMFKWQFVLFTANYKHILQSHSQSMYITHSHSILKLKYTKKTNTSQVFPIKKVSGTCSKVRVWRARLQNYRYQSLISVGFTQIHGENGFLVHSAPTWRTTIIYIYSDRTQSLNASQCQLSEHQQTKTGSLHPHWKNVRLPWRLSAQHAFYRAFLPKYTCQLTPCTSDTDTGSFCSDGHGAGLAQYSLETKCDQ